MKEKDKRYLQKCFLQMLLEGNHTFSEEELNNWDLSLSLSLQGKNWECVIVKVNKADFAGAQCLHLVHQCEKMISERNLDGYVTINSRMDIILLLPYKQINYGDILKRTESRASCRTGWNIQIGIGKPYKKLSQIHFSKEEAYEALAWAGDQVKIADIRDVRFEEKKSSANAKADYKKILDQFANGSVEQLYSNLNTLAEQVRSSTVIQPDAPYPTSIRRTMIELLVEMLHIASDAGVDVDKEIGYVDPYRKIFELQGTPAIIQWVTEIAEGLSEAMRSRKKQIEMNQLEQVKQYIHAHISDMDLSLSSVSQTVNMSPGYFSAFFIREAGIGFKEYVTAERIVLAKRLLQDSRESINAISERCGFLSPSYFISVFKSQTGMTPGAYRKLKN